MGKPNGSRTHYCPVCRYGYTFTNWMRRRGVPAVIKGERRLMTDTHQIACARKAGLLVSGEVPDERQ